MGSWRARTTVKVVGVSSTEISGGHEGKITHAMGDWGGEGIARWSNES